MAESGFQRGGSAFTIAGWCFSFDGLVEVPSEHDRTWLGASFPEEQQQRGAHPPPFCALGVDVDVRGSKVGALLVGCPAKFAGNCYEHDFTSPMPAALCDPSLLFAAGVDLVPSSLPRVTHAISPDLGFFRSLSSRRFQGSSSCTRVDPRASDTHPDHPCYGARRIQHEINTLLADDTILVSSRTVSRPTSLLTDTHIYATLFLHGCEISPLASQLRSILQLCSLLQPCSSRHPSASNTDE